MKTHAFAKHLEQLAKLLRRLPDMDLDTRIANDLQGFLPGFASDEKAESRHSRAFPRGIEARLSGMSPAEIESFLSSDEEAFTAASLSKIAATLGLTTSKRQSKNALVNMITRHYEAGQMHSIIRGARADDSSTSS